MLAFTILVLEAYYHKFHVRILKLSKHFVVFFIALSLFVYFLKPYIDQGHDYLALYESMSMETVIKDPPEVEVITPENAKNYDWQPASSPRVLAEIIRSRVLKVGYYPYIPPFNYFNWYGKLVGYDIAFAYSLGKFLKSKVVFLPFTWENLDDHLKKGHFDIAMAPVLMNPENIQNFPLTHPYLNSENVLIVREKDQKKFDSFEKIQNKTLKLGIFYGFDIFISQYLPVAGSKYITSLDEIKHDQEIDALLVPKIEALVFCRKFPDFIIMDYGEKLGKPFFAYAVRMKFGDEAPTNFLGLFQQWREFSQQQGFVKKQQDYWIYGKIPLKEKPRWSIMRNVLHWNTH